MPCGWECNRRSGITLAMRHRLQWFIHLRAHGLDREMSIPPMLSCGVWPIYLYLPHLCLIPVFTIRQHMSHLSCLSLSCNSIIEVCTGMGMAESCIFCGKCAGMGTDVAGKPRVWKLELRGWNLFLREPRRDTLEILHRITILVQALDY